MTNEADDFTKWSDEQALNAKLELKRLIDDNEKAFGDSPFLASLREQLQEYGHLTERQVQRLKDGPPPRLDFSGDEYDGDGYRPDQWEPEW